MTISPEISRALKNVHISPDLSSFVVGDRVVEVDQASELRFRLPATLYEEWHIGHSALEVEERRLWWDPDLREALHASVPHRSTSRRAIMLGPDPELDNGDVVVRMEGVKVRIPSNLVDDDVEVGNRLQIRMDAARPALSPGFFLVDGSQGLFPSGAVLRVYFHLADSEVAPLVWGEILRTLEGMDVRYRAKVLAARRYYPRRDAMVVYLSNEDWHAVEKLVAIADDLPLASGHTSVFTQPLAEGVSYAWEPEDGRQGRPKLSFGQHRSSVVAEALIDSAFEVGESSQQALEERVEKAMFQAGIDPRRPHRNLTSPLLPEVSRGE